MLRVKARLAFRFFGVSGTGAVALFRVLSGLAVLPVFASCAGVGSRLVKKFPHGL